MPERVCNDKLLTHGAIAIDVESTGLLWRHGDQPYCFSITDEDFNNFYVSFYVDPYTRQVSYDEFAPTPAIPGHGAKWKPKDFIDYLAEMMQDESRPKVFHNAKFDIGHIGTHMGIWPSGKIHDTRLMARIYNSDEPSYKLKPLAKKYCNIGVDDIEELKNWVSKLRRKAARQPNWKLAKDMEADYWIVQQAGCLLDLYPNEERHIQLLDEVYCRKDTIRTMALFSKYYDGIYAEEGSRVIYERELELMELVQRMEARGVSVDKTIALADRQYSVDMAKQHLQNIRDFTNNPQFNPNSPAQVQYLVFDKLKIKPTKFTEGGAASADYKVLKDNESQHPILHDIIQYKAHDKAVGTFFDTYIDLMLPDPENEGRYIIHANFNQDNARTGRFSCDTPNLQQVSNPDTSFKGTDVIQARNPFGPRPGYTWYSFDYSQMELRVFAGCANVQQIIDDILSGRDPNTEVANRAWGGRGNPIAIRQAALSLELGNSEPTSIEVAEAWKQYGWNHDLAMRGERSVEAMMTAERWLKDNNYDIVKAEKGIGKKITRNRAKMVMFAKLYGGGAKAVMGLLYCSELVAKQFLEDIDKAYPQINRYMRRLTREALDEGYITNKYGRKLHIARERAYTCVNYMIQGTSADMMKLSMLDCDKWLRRNEIPGYLVMTIHDEIIFEIKNTVDHMKILPELKFYMEDHEKYVGVPMAVGIKKAEKQWSLDEPVNL